MPEPQPAAVVTTASTSVGKGRDVDRARAAGPARDRRRAAPARRSSPGSRGTTTSTPQCDSTRIAAAPMPGASTCCAQPASSATRARRVPRAGVSAGSGCAGGTDGGTSASIARIDAGSSGAVQRARRPEPQRPGEAAPDTAASRAAGRAAARASSDAPLRPRGVGAERRQQIAIGHAGRAGGRAGQAAEAAVDVRLHVVERQRAFEHALHQHDAAARRVHLLAELAVGRARRQAEAAVHAGRHGVRHVRAGRPERLGVDVVLHSAAQPRKVPRGSMRAAARGRGRRRRDGRRASDRPAPAPIRATPDSCVLARAARRGRPTRPASRPRPLPRRRRSGARLRPRASAASRAWMRDGVTATLASGAARPRRSRATPSTRRRRRPAPARPAARRPWRGRGRARRRRPSARASIASAAPAIRTITCAVGRQLERVGIGGRAPHAIERGQRRRRGWRSATRSVRCAPRRRKHLEGQLDEDAEPAAGCRAAGGAGRSRRRSSRPCRRRGPGGLRRRRTCAPMRKSRTPP